MADDGMNINFDITDKSFLFLEKAEELAFKVEKQAAKAGVDKAKELVPEKTGALKKGIGSTVKKDIRTISMEIGGKDYKTGWFVFGTRKMKKNDFLTFGMDLAVQTFEEKFTEGLNNIQDLV